MVRSLVLAEPPIHQWVAGDARGAALFQQFMTTVHEPAGQAFAKGDTEAAMRILVDAFDGPGAFKKLPPENRTAIMSNAPLLPGPDRVVRSVSESVHASDVEPARACRS